MFDECLIVDISSIFLKILRQLQISVQFSNVNLRVSLSLPVTIHKSCYVFYAEIVVIFLYFANL